MKTFQTPSVDGRACSPPNQGDNISESQCLCATSLKQVEAAWELVYGCYSEMGLIRENAFEIHTVPGAIGDHACVIFGPDPSDVGYTVTLFRDNPMGLALDSVYEKELNQLRHSGRRLLEVGMLADRRKSVTRGRAALFSMMRGAIYYGLHNDLTDIVIGVHPRHAPFYQRCYGFEAFGATTNYPLVQDHPVVPLRLQLREGLAKPVLPRGLADVRNNPIAASAFSNLFAFRPTQLIGSRIADFLKKHYCFDPSQLDASKMTDAAMACPA